MQGDSSVKRELATLEARLRSFEAVASASAAAAATILKADKDLHKITSRMNKDLRKTIPDTDKDLEKLLVAIGS